MNACNILCPLYNVWGSQKTGEGEAPDPQDPLLKCMYLKGRFHEPTRDADEKEQVNHQIQIQGINLHVFYYSA